MNIFTFTDYRKLIKERLRTQEGAARGQLSRLAKVLRVHTTFVSLVFREQRDFSPEQAVLLAQHWGFTDAETDYLLDLVQLSRAGDQRLREYTKRRIASAQASAKKLVTQFEHERQLGAEERQTFYSSWHYSAIRIFTSIGAKGATVEEVCKRFHLPRATVVDALQFLVRTQLVAANGERYVVGPQRTFLEKGHPLLKCHHANWRLKALQQYERLSDDELMFSTTLSISRADFARFREHLAEFVKSTAKVIEDTEPEDVACLTLDLFWVR